MPQVMRKQPPGIKRLLVIVSAVAYVIFLGIPVWWHTTSLHRPRLPHAAMQQVAIEASSSAAFLPVSLEVVLVVPTGYDPQETAGDVAAALHGSLQAAVAAAASVSHTAVQVTAAVNTSQRHCQQHPAAAEPSAACGIDWAAAASRLTSSTISGSATIMHQHQQLDQWLQQQQQQQQGQQQGQASLTSQTAGHYRLFLLPFRSAEPTAAATGAQATPEPPTLVVGRHRHAWVSYDPSWATSHLQGVQSLAAAAAVKALSCCFALHAGPAGLQAAGSLPISPSGHTQLSLSLLNADPEGGRPYTWDMEEWEARYLTPIMASLAPVTAVSVESQVLQYTAARLTGSWSDKHGAYVVKGPQLPFFIDSEWSLDSGRAVTPQGGLLGYVAHSPAAPAPAAAAAATAGARTGAQHSTFAGAATGTGDGASLDEPHVLQLLVYVPPKQHQPLQLLGRKSRVRDSNSYVIPSWGGLMVLNPSHQPNSSSSSSNTGSDEATAAGSSSSSSSGGAAAAAAAVELTPEQYQHIAAVVIAQLQALFGVSPAENPSSSNSSSGSDGLAAVAAPQVQQLPAGRSGLSAWQVDALMRQRSAHNVREAARVLAALSTLVQELPNLEMPDIIGQQVAEALADINRAWQHTAAGDYTAAAAASTAAHGAAEAAFSHPAVLTQLNFPDSHKLGVYMPLFLPLCVPLVQGLALQLSHLVRRRRECQ